MRLCMDGLVALEFGKRFDGFAGLFFGEPQIVETLQIEPELRAGAEEVSEAQSCVAGNAARPIQDLRDAVGGYANLARQFGGAHIERLQFFSEMLTRMNCRDRHGRSFLLAI